MPEKKEHIPVSLPKKPETKLTEPEGVPPNFATSPSTDQVSSISPFSFFAKKINCLQDNLLKFL